MGCACFKEKEEAVDCGHGCDGEDGEDEDGQGEDLEDGDGDDEQSDNQVKASMMERA